MFVTLWVSCHCCLGCGRPLILPNDTYDYTHRIAALLRYLQNLRVYLRAGSSGGVSGRFIVVIAQRGRPLIPYLTWLSYYLSCHFFSTILLHFDRPSTLPQLLLYLYLHTRTRTKKKGSGGKKKVTTYQLFAKEMRPKIISEKPDLSFGEVGKELGARWRALSDAQKEAYKK